MEEACIETIEDLVPLIRKYLMPHIEEAVEVCTKAYLDDPYNDNWTFGTHLWRNVWNRITEVAKSNESPLELYGKASEFKFKIGPYVIHHHRVDGETLIPRAAKSVKSAAIQLNMFGFNLNLNAENIILAIEAEPEEGLKDLFVGELQQDSYTKEFYWEKSVQVFTHEELSLLGRTTGESAIEEEAVPEVLYQPDEIEPDELVSLAQKDHEFIESGEKDA